jgi:hypothetical protein
MENHFIFFQGNNLKTERFYDAESIQKGFLKDYETAKTCRVIKQYCPL